MSTAVALCHLLGQARRVDKTTAFEFDADQVAAQAAIGIEEIVHTNAVAAVAHADQQFIALAAEGQVGARQALRHHQGVAALGVNDPVAAITAREAVAVSAVAAGKHVVAAAAIDHVIASAAVQLVVAATALQPIVAAAAVEVIGALCADHPVASGQAELGQRVAQRHEAVAAGCTLVSQ